MNVSDIERQLWAAAPRGASAVSGFGGAVRSAAGGVLRTLGGRPVGDPAAMRAVAAAFRRDADRLNQVTERLHQVVEHTDWQGPGAERARARYRLRTNEARGMAHHLRDLAQRLETGATRLQNDQHTWDVRFRRMVDDATRSLKRLVR